MTTRDALAATIMAALNEHGGSYRLPKDPSNLAYFVADAVLAATPSTPGLDVKRLAEAIFEAERPDGWATWQEYLASFAHPPTQADVWHRKAERVAAEYAALTSTEGEPK